MPKHEFLSNGSIIGGIYTFKLESRTNYSLSAGRGRRFNLAVYPNQEDPYKVIESKKAVFGGDQKWSAPELNLKMEAETHIRLHDGAVFKDIQLKTYISVYYKGFTSVLFWLDLGDKQVNYPQIVELVSMIKNQESHQEKGHRINFRQTHVKRNYASLYQLFSDLQEDLSVQLRIKLVPSKISYIYPVTYLKEISDCADAAAIIEKYSSEIVGICDLWPHYHEHLKASEVERILATDLHPFDFGVSVYTSTGMLELHPTNFKLIHSPTNLTLEQKHDYEYNFLLLITEVSIFHLFTLKWYDVQLTAVGLKAYNVHWSPWSFIRNLHIITNLHYATIESLSLFTDARLASKSYIPQTINNIDTLIGIQDYADNVKNKLNDIKQQLMILYSMLTTVFIILLTIVGLMLAFVQFWSGNQKDNIQVIKPPIKNKAEHLKHKEIIKDTAVINNSLKKPLLQK